MEAGAAVGAAVAATAGPILFNYNRQNFQWDSALRFDRFTSAREFGVQQATQYRSDLRALTDLTQKRCGLYATVAALCVGPAVAMYCAGRLGLNGPAPPMWLMALWLTNNTACFGFMVMTIWLALHCSFRAQAASVHLLTRKVRLPVPTMQVLDRARQFGSEFEQQSWGDIFRVPYLANSGAPKTDEAAVGTRRVRARSASPMAARYKWSGWVRDELTTDRAGTITGSFPSPPDAAPEHFQLYAAVQKEWFLYGVYARICLLYGFTCWVQSLCYYGLGHINVELRAFWVAYAAIFVFAMLMIVLLRFDVVQGRNPLRRDRLPNCQYLGPAALLPTAMAMSLDYRVQFEMVGIVFTWILVFLVYIMQVLYALRLLELLQPDEAEREEKVGNSWWPQHWVAPSVFHHVIYDVAPPEKLQPGQVDLVRELREGAKGEPGVDPSEETSGGAVSPSGISYTADAIKQVGPSYRTYGIYPPRVVGSLQFAVVCAWVFLLLALVVDVCLGEQALVSPPGPPHTRKPKTPFETGTALGFPWRAGSKPYIPENFAWSDEKKYVDEQRRKAGSGRRLDANRDASTELQSAIESLFDALPAAPEPVLTNLAVEWPGFFEPQLLACSMERQGVVVLTRRGVGAAVQELGADGEPAVTAFKLLGLAHMAPLVATTWSGEGLLTVTRAGDLVTCPGSPSTHWACAPSQELPHRLPVAAGSQLRAAAVAWLQRDGKPVLHAALVEEDVPDLVSLYTLETLTEDTEKAFAWVPLGDAPLPLRDHLPLLRSSLSFAVDGDLLLATESGDMVRRRLQDGSIQSQYSHPWGSSDMWYAACPSSNGALHLLLEKVEGSHARRPHLVQSSPAASKVSV